MFWKSNFNSSVQIDDLLSKEDVTLEEILDEEEVLQECKAQNKKLIDFLVKPEILKEMVTLVVTEPAVDYELKSRFKYANLAAEVLTCGDSTISDHIVGDPDLLLILYEFLNNEPPLNPLLASFFSKVFGMLISRRTEQNLCLYQFTCFRALDFLKSQGNFVELAVRHIGTSAIMDLLTKLICDVDDLEIKANINKWLCDSQLIELLVEKLSKEDHLDEHSSIDQLLCDIMLKSRDPSNNTLEAPNSPAFTYNLCSVIEREDIINKFLDGLLPEDCSDSSVCHIVNLLVSLISEKAPVNNQQMQQQRMEPTGSVDSNDSGETNDNRINVAKIIIKRLPDLQSILLRPSEKRIMTAYNVEMEPLGTTRLKIITLFNALVATNDCTIHRALAKLNTLQHLLDIFFKFSLNNFVHSQVVQCLLTILTSIPQNSSAIEEDDLEKMDKELEEEMFDPQKEEEKHPLLVQLITKCHIIDRIVEAFMPSVTEENESKSVVEHNTCGYMGHLLIITNTIINQIEEGINSIRIKHFINTLPASTLENWNKFTSEVLIKVNNRCKILPLPGFKEMGMDGLGDVAYSETEFKDGQDYFSGTKVRLMQSECELEDPSSSPLENIRSNDELFSEMCAVRYSNTDELFNQLWEDKEKEIDFDPSVTQSKEESEHHSSSEEEDLEDDFANLRNPDEKMDVDNTDEWSAVFDKKDDISAEGAFNPWRSATAKDVSDDTCWANFDSDTFSSNPTNPFNTISPIPTSNDTDTPNFFSADATNLVPVQSAVSEFNADFDSAFGASSPFVPDTEKISSSPNPASKEEPLETTPETDSSVKPKSSSSESSKDSSLEDNFMFLSSRGLIKPATEGAEKSIVQNSIETNQDSGGE